MTASVDRSVESNLMSLIHEAGFRGNAANIMYGIVMAESGGNAYAHNTNAGTGDNSYGLAQINMLGSMGPERLRQYGLSSYNDLFDPLTNLKVAYQMSGGGTHFGDWSTYNSGAYQQHMGETGGTVSYSGSRDAAGGSGPSSTGTGSGTGPGGQMTAADFMQTDGLKNLFNTVPELKHLMGQAISGDWSPVKFQNAVENSAWYKTHADTARSVIMQQANDPASYQRNLATVEQSLRKMAGNLGIQAGAGRIADIAQYAMLTGNDKQQSWLTDQLFYGRDWSHIGSIDSLKGGMANQAQAISKLGADYGYQWTPTQIANFSQNILSGTTTIDTYKADLQSWAKSAFPSLAKQIDGGQTVRDLASPYMQSMANILEVDPQAITTYDPLIRKALQGVQDPHTQQHSTTPLWQFEQQLRSDPRWQNTKNATDTVSTALTKIGHDFGFAV